MEIRVCISGAAKGIRGYGAEGDARNCGFHAQYDELFRASSAESAAR